VRLLTWCLFSPNSSRRPWTR